MADKVNLVCGFGVNDANYAVRPRDGAGFKICKAYSSWHNMISRVHGKAKSKLCPTYSDVSVCEQWRSFSRFKSWWVNNYVDGWHLDKDILTDEKVYSPETCIYIPPWLNLFLTDRKAKRGKFHIGVCWHKRDKKFMCQCRNPETGKQEVVGMFDSQDMAYLAWLERKTEIASKMKSEMDDIDVRIYPRVMDIIRSKK